MPEDNTPQSITHSDPADIAAEDLPGRIRQRLETLGISANAASSRAGLDRTSLKSILDGRSKNPRADTLLKLAHVLDCTFEWLVSGAGPSPAAPAGHPASSEIIAARPAGGSAFPPRHEMPLNVPVFGTAAGSLGEGAFSLEMTAVDYVRRPPGIANAADVYAVYIEGDSMEPRFYPGELVYVNPHRPARPGDFVVIQMQNGLHAEIQSYCKKLIRKSDETLYLEQFNPKTNLELPLGDVRAIHRILPLNELMGI
ncbi:XRE family transcriptional regulator [Aestuariispira insulae]|uniref:Phage repressor protein C with HTH and peptisase S24 domain n=1 Tax=Aestuariispira insulae TaxID=1461337 RepID=A0A3D9HRL4_9PROT|nr:S24 family peptidase [Aestuariispira insulae]RED52132.1 phage repressor protein C with HTH and peptisase S24 domain [Aestuariispira insulae]